MTRKQVPLKTQKSKKVLRRTAEKGRRNAEAKRVIAEKMRGQAEGERKAEAHKARNLEEERTVMEELRKTAEDVRQMAETMRKTSMMNIESQERMRESAEIMRSDQFQKIIKEIRQNELIWAERIQKVIEEAHLSINNLYQGATDQLNEIEKISKSAKETLHRFQEMVRNASEQMGKGRS